ncbi:hypothetical protein [Paraburkholderia fungorum]|uniref:hypothetical protein n=1 Tax=Paraburkholderia fungorum TaxID=134537 RepID=UPI0038BC6663
MCDAIDFPRNIFLRYRGCKVSSNLQSAAATGDGSGWAFFRQRPTRSRSRIPDVDWVIDTTVLDGDESVFDRAALVDELKVAHAAGPVYAANHARDRESVGGRLRAWQIGRFQPRRSTTSYRERPTNSS